jgi:mannose/fructose/N-acetylgalactosamine-specific phosphotransferase system component IID
MQKVILVSDHTNNNGLSRVNDKLEDGWKVIMISPMSGAGDTHVSVALVVIEKEDD